MPEYYHSGQAPIYLMGPDGKSIRLAPHKKHILSEFFDRYVKKGLLFRSQSESQQPIQKKAHIEIRQPVKDQQPIIQRVIRPIKQENNDIRKDNEQPRQVNHIVTPQAKHQAKPRTIITNTNKVVGRKADGDATNLLLNNLSILPYPISCNIAVGILSYNRLHCLKRLVDSILKYTDLRKITVFISDDCSTSKDLLAYLDDLKKLKTIIVINNDIRLGVAGNTNRIMKCLARFSYCMILNDDVEVLDFGWEQFYPSAAKDTGYHHFCYRAVGVYGAPNKGTNTTVGRRTIQYVNDKPHGAVIFYTNHAFSKVGYFDERYGLYGMEHVDWSRRVSMSNIQQHAYADVDGSDTFFVVHNEKTSVDQAEKTQYLNAAKELFKMTPNKILIDETKATVPSISVVIPCRNAIRSGSIPTVVAGIRGQRFPCVEIIVVEHDNVKNLDGISPSRHFLVNSDGKSFNKSLAFNVGVSHATHDKVVLHDADLLTRSDYLSSVYDKLDKYDSCHIGKTVIYTTQSSCGQINSVGVVDQEVKCDRIVGYFEGGSLACKKSTYWAVGGFNEDFWGYGVEDCEFYARLSKNSNWCDDRSFDFLHMWHGRSGNWNSEHNINKILGASLDLLSMSDRISALVSKNNAAGYNKGNNE